MARLGDVSPIRPGSRGLAPRLAAVSSLADVPRSPSGTGGTPTASTPPPPCDARHQTPLPDPARSARRPLGRPLVLLIAGVYFLVPLLASTVFTVNIPGQGLTLSSYTRIFTAPGFAGSLLLSLGLAAATVALVLLITVPAAAPARLSAPRLRPVLEVVCTLPLVVPPVALTAGLGTVLRWGPEKLSTTPLYQTFVAVQNPDFPLVLVLAYAVMALPFVYRALDAGLRSVDVRTLVEAARDCGASWPRALVSAVLPNLRGALLNASFLTLALVLGEFTVASLLGFQPFAVWIVQASGSDARLSVAVSLLSLLLTWVLLLALTTVGNRRRSPRSSRTSEGKTPR